MARPNGMTRLLRLYARVEQMRSLERCLSSQAVEEAVAAVSIHAAVNACAVTDGRASLSAGDSERWAIAQAAQMLSVRQREHLVRILNEREVTHRHAVKDHRESRLTMERVERLTTKMDAERSLDQSRRDQAASDDRFASRAAWIRTKSMG